MGTPLGPKYIPYTYMDPLGFISFGSGSCRRLDEAAQRNTCVAFECAEQIKQQSKVRSRRLHAV